MTSEKTDGDLRLARALVLRDHPTNQVLLHISRSLKMSPNDVELVRVYTKEIGGKIFDTTLPVSSGFEVLCRQSFLHIDEISHIRPGVNTSTVPDEEAMD